MSKFFHIFQIFWLLCQTFLISTIPYPIKLDRWEYSEMQINVGRGPAVYIYINIYINIYIYIYIFIIYIIYIYIYIYIHIYMNFFSGNFWRFWLLIWDSKLAEFKAYLKSISSSEIIFIILLKNIFLVCFYNQILRGNQYHYRERLKRMFPNRQQLELQMLKKSSDN